MEQEVSYIRGSDQIKRLVTQNILARAEGNFLRARLVSEEIVYCHTASGIQETLNELPSDMQRMYDRMEQANSPKNQAGS